MAALIPAIGTCVSRMTGGERRFAYRLEQKLEDDWLYCYDVPFAAALSAGHPPPKPLPIKQPNIREEADYIADHLKEADKPGSRGAAWPPFTATTTSANSSTPCYGIPAPVVTYQGGITFTEKKDTVKFLPMHSCKGPEFPLVAIQGAERTVDEGRKDEGRGCYMWR